MVNKLFTRVFGSLAALRGKPIPELGAMRLAKIGARDWPIDRDAESFAESMARIESHGLQGRNHYAHPHNPPYWRVIDGAIDALWLRETVCGKLARVDARLRAQGLRLHIYDGWRPTAVQAYFHDVWMVEELGLRRPELKGDALMEEVERYWSAPTTDPRAPAPHSTGGAVDLTLCWEGGDPLYMGCLFDDPTALAHTDRFELSFDETGSYSMDEARANRRLLYWLMVDEGFASHPDEWWHFSWGDQMWAKQTGAPAARYGMAEPPG
jgi:zinc D-Ala-D-Ala dipeptidase